MYKVPFLTCVCAPALRLWAEIAVSCQDLQSDHGPAARTELAVFARRAGRSDGGGGRFQLAAQAEAAGVGWVGGLPMVGRPSMTPAVRATRPAS